MMQTIEAIYQNGMFKPFLSEIKIRFRRLQTGSIIWVDCSTGLRP